MASTGQDDVLNLLSDLATAAKKRRVSGFIFAHTGKNSLAATVRKGIVEKIEDESPSKVVIKVHLGQKSSAASTNSLTQKDLALTLVPGHRSCPHIVREQE